MDTTVTKPVSARHSTGPRLRGNICHCCACGLTFLNPAAFDRHRVARFVPDKRHCCPPEVLPARGLMRDLRWLWRIARSPRIRVEGSRRNGDHIRPDVRAAAPSAEAWQ